MKKISINELKKHFKERIVFDSSRFDSMFFENKVFYIIFDSVELGYVDTAGKIMSFAEPPHIELCPKMSEKYFNAKESLKRFYSNREFITFINKQWKE